MARVIVWGVLSTLPHQPTHGTFAFYCPPQMNLEPGKGSQEDYNHFAVPLNPSPK